LREADGGHTLRRFTVWRLAQYGAVVAVLSATVLGARPQATSQEASTVSLPFFVTDAKGNPIRDVVATDISILDDKQPPQSPPSISTGKELPLEIAAVIDDSGSMLFNKSFTATVKELRVQLPLVLEGDQDRIVIVAFSNEPTATDFMDRSQFSKFWIYVNPYGPSAFYDAVVLACKRLSAGSEKRARRVVLAVTDADHDASRATPEAAIRSLQDARVCLFVIETAKEPSSKAGRHGHEVCEKLAENAGGFTYGERPEAVPDVFASIRQAIDSMHIATYVAPQPDKKGRHAVVIKAPAHRDWRVHVTKAYEVE